MPGNQEPEAAGRAVMVTGASTGIGFHAACYLAARGFQVFGGVRKEVDGTPLEREGVVPVLLDVTSEASVRVGRDFVADQLRDIPLWGLVNNAGVTAPGPLELLEVEEYRQVMEVNLLGVVTVTKAFLPLLKTSKGRIINVSSVSVNSSPPFLSPYVASKSALESLSHCLRREIYPYGIDVVILQPGNVDTPLWQKAASRDIGRAAGTIYEPPLVSLKRYVEFIPKMSPSRTSEAIYRALSKRRPPLLMSVVAQWLEHLLMRWLPERMKDRLIAQQVWGRVSPPANPKQEQ